MTVPAGESELTPSWDVESGETVSCDWVMVVCVMDPVDSVDGTDELDVEPVGVELWTDVVVVEAVFDELGVEAGELVEVGELVETVLVGVGVVVAVLVVELVEVTVER